jgi:hypothetical protein
MASKQGSMSLDRLHCHRRNEVFGAEPYLLTAFFKVDGDTIAIDVSEGEFFLNGPCTFVGTAGAHGNLGDTDVHDGDDVSIPSALGQAEFVVKPVPARPGLFPPEFGRIETPGFVGVVFALLEEESVTDSAAEAGRAAFNREVEKAINKIIPTLRRDVKEQPTPEDLAQLSEQVGAAIQSAIADAQGFFRNVLTFFAGDFLIGADVFFSSSSRDIDERLQRFIPNPNNPGGPPVLADHYEIFGSILVRDELLQVTGVTGDGAMWHTIRHPDRWDGFGDVKGQSGNPGHFQAVAVAGVLE